MKKFDFYLKLILLSLFLLNPAIEKTFAQEYFYDSDFNVSNIYDMQNAYDMQNIYNLQNPNAQNINPQNTNVQYFNSQQKSNNDFSNFSDLEKKIEENYNALQKRLDEAQKNNPQNQSKTVQNQINPKNQSSTIKNANPQNQSLAKNSNVSDVLTPQPKQNYKDSDQYQEKESTLEKVKDFFSSFKSKKKKEMQNRGYYGELPDLTRRHKYKNTSNPTSKNTDYKIPTIEELNNEINTEKLKKAPLDDPLFLDNVLKKEDTNSQYLKDIQKTKFALNNLKKCIEEQGDIQRFNACVNVIDLTVNNFEQKYKNTPDALKESYRDIINVNYYSKLLGNLLYDSNYYAKYIPTQEGKYSTNNIDSEKQKLLIKLNRTIFVINQES